MKRYVSHKEVEAAKIIAEENQIGVDGTFALTIEGENGVTDRIAVSEEWFRKHSGDNSGMPHSLVGGYFIRYADGYTSWSPAEPFDSGYTELGEKRAGLSFGDALKALKEGKRVAREGWNGKDMFIFLVDGSTFEVNRAPLDKFYAHGTQINYHAHIDMRTADGTIVPWLSSQTDTLAEDWLVLD